MPLIESTVNAMRTLFGSNGTSYSTLAETTRRNTEDHQAMYGLLRDLYYNDRATKEADSTDLVLGLRNPARAVVDFYAATMWPGTLPEALPIETDNSALERAIHQVWDWSNWNARKQVYARNSAMLGDQLIKVATRRNANDQVERVYLQLIEPEHLTDFDTDERDFLTYVRLDVPRERRNGDKTEQYTHTEVWDKGSGLQRVWEHPHGFVDDIKMLGRPARETSMESMGIDFLPFVHAKHIDLGSKRGVAAITPALVKAQEANRMASRLHQLMFQYGKADMVLHSGWVGPDGETMMAPIVDDDGDELELGGSRLIRLPSGWQMTPSIANLPFMAHLEVLNAHIEHLQQTDLPELAYYRIADSREMSGKAIRFMLTAAIAKAEEARGNAEAALIRADQMALTIGIFHGLFTDLGSYKEAYTSGALRHTFRPRSVVPLSEEEEAAVERTQAEAGIAKQALGWSNQQIQRDMGVSDADQRLMATERTVSDAERGARLLRARDAGEVDRAS